MSKNWIPFSLLAFCSAALAGPGSSRQIDATTIRNGSATLTLPTSTSTIATRALSETLTNKILTGNTAVNLISGSGTLILNTSGTATVPNQTGNVIVSGNTSIVNADINASAGIVDTKLATISTASKVSNSATTAASANTASAIVARDGSGNFTAGTVTANLTGNVTGNVTGNLTGNVSGSITSNVAAKTGNYTVVASDGLITGDVSGGAFTITLPTAVGVTGETHTIKRIDQTLATALTLATTSSQTIDGVTTRKLMTQYEQFTVVSNGANWYILSHTYPSGWVAFTPTGSWTTNVTYTGFWRRVGDELEQDIQVATSGVPDNLALSVNIVSGLTYNTAKLASTASKNFGFGDALDAAVQRYGLWVAYSSTTAMTFTAVSYAVTPAQIIEGSNVARTVPFAFGAGDLMTAHWSMPVTNWEP